jgi:FKBP-type peptidyl-prolyl cis-trans isomerase FklB
MKSALVAILGVWAAWGAFAADPSPLKDPKERISYTLGMNFGRDLKRNNVEISPDLFVKGLNDALGGGKTLLTEEEGREIMMAFQQEMRAKMTEKQKGDSDKNKKTGDAFLAENKKKEGVQTTASGLQYKVITKGTGKVPTSNDTVICHYRGTLIDGTEFDSSYKRAEPATFPVTGVIKGWIEALQMMPVGSKWQLVIPAELAYGDRGNPRIPGGSVLIFDIELLSIKPPEATAK